MKPKSTSSSRTRTYVLAFAGLVLFFFSGSVLHRSGHLKVPTKATFRYFYAPARKTIVHPIPNLMKEAEEKFENMIASQSKSLSEAVKTCESSFDLELSYLAGLMRARTPSQGVVGCQVQHMLTLTPPL